MTQLAVADTIDGKNANRMERLTDELPRAVSGAPVFHTCHVLPVVETVRQGHCECLFVDCSKDGTHPLVSLCGAPQRYLVEVAA